MFSLTGRFKMGKDEIIELIRSLGGEYSSTLSQNITHLLAADTNSTVVKLRKVRNKDLVVVGR